MGEATRELDSYSNIPSEESVQKSTSRKRLQAPRSPDFAMRRMMQKHIDCSATVPQCRGQDTRREGVPPARAQDGVHLAPSILRMQGSEAHFTDVTCEAECPDGEQCAQALTMSSAENMVD